VPVKKLKVKEEGSGSEIEGKFTRKVILPVDSSARVLPRQRYLLSISFGAQVSDEITKY